MSQMNEVATHLRTLMVQRDAAYLTDAQLLECFVNRQDTVALEALVRRHSPMVWGVCRRVLANFHDAEDAFQATFLVLVRKAASITSRELVANWIYAVAAQTALKARTTAAKRSTRERQVTEMPERAAADQAPWSDLQPLLDAELSRLPGKYRAVIVLCDLEGKSRKEVALQLRVPEGTVASRMATARTMLARRLARRGVAVSGAALAAGLTEHVASAGAPASVVSSAIKAASLLAAGNAAGAISVKVIALTSGVINAMTITKVKTITGVLVAVLAATTFTYGMVGGQPGGGGDEKDSPDRLKSMETKALTQAEQPKEKSPDPKQPAPPAQDDKTPPHRVEKPDKKGNDSLPYRVAGEPTEEQLLVVSKNFMSAIRHPQDQDVAFRYRDYFDPRYLKQHGLTDRDIAFELAYSPRILSIDVADDLRTVLCTIELNGGERKDNGGFTIRREAIILRWVVYEGRLYLSPEKAPDPKTGIFKPWILRTVVYEIKQSPASVPYDKSAAKPPRIVEKTDMKSEYTSGMPWKIGPKPTAQETEEVMGMLNKAFFAEMGSFQGRRFREFFDPRYLKKHGLTDSAITFEVAHTWGIHCINVADDNRTALVTTEIVEDGKGVNALFVMRWAIDEDHIYISPINAPDKKTGIFKPWILRTKLN